MFKFPRSLKSLPLAAMLFASGALVACQWRPAEGMALDRLDLVSRAVHGFLLAPPAAVSVETVDGEPVSLSPASDADLILFVEDACTVCPAAIQQARDLSAQRKVLVAPIDLSLWDSPEPDGLLQSVAAGNTMVFHNVGGTGLPYWIGRDACQRAVAIHGMLNDDQLAVLSSCKQ